MKRVFNKKMGLQKYSVLRAIFLLITTLQFALVVAQTGESVEEFNELSLGEKKEHLIEELFSDTIKYSPEDVYHGAIGSNNINSYSQLYIINGKQYFKFDIVERKCVEEFVQNYLRNSKLRSIDRMDKNMSTALYGENGKNGVTIIWMKNLKNISTNNCGFLSDEDLQGNNFDQWKEGELHIKRCFLGPQND